MPAPPCNCHSFTIDNTENKFTLTVDLTKIKENDEGTFELSVNLSDIRVSQIQKMDFII